MPGIILPNGADPTGELLLPESVRRTPIWKCPFCPATYRKGEDAAIARHIDTHDDEIGEQLEQRMNEPLRQHDEEHLKFLRERAAAEGDTSVKGVTR